MVLEEVKENVKNEVKRVGKMIDEYEFDPIFYGIKYMFQGNLYGLRCNLKDKTINVAEIDESTAFQICFGEYYFLKKSKKYELDALKDALKEIFQV